MHTLRICTVFLTFFMIFAAAVSSAAGCRGKPAPDISGETWLNSPPLTLSELRGKVVLVEFWTLGCSNCRNVEPYVKKWHDKYASQGLVVVGVHTPEFGYERELGNVREYVRSRGIKHAVVIDNDFAIWNRYANRYWPAMYLLDKQGAVCATKIGEGDYEDTERKIRELLAQR